MESNSVKKFVDLRGRIRALTKLFMFASLTLFTASVAHALQFELGNDVTLDVDTTVKYSLQMRVDDPNGANLSPGAANYDDGNRNFEKYELTSNRFQVTSDVDLQWKDFGVFVRGRAFYDYAYTADNSNDSPFTNNSLASGNISDHQKWDPITEDRHGKDEEILDAFVYGRFDLGGHEAELRVGAMVNSWGESLFMRNSVATAMSPLDARFATVPGVELRDLFLPTEQVYASIGITDTLTLAGFYKWEWEKTRTPEPGFFLPLNNSFADILDDAGTDLIAPVPGGRIIRDEDGEAKDDGQYGFALRWVCDALNASEFGLYYINHHGRLPKLVFDPTPLFVGAAPRFNMQYQEDVKVYGASVGTEIWDINFGLEVTYRTDAQAPVVNPNIPLPDPLNVEWDTADIYQAQLSFIGLFPQVMFADQWLIMGEIGYNEVHPDGDYSLRSDKSAWGVIVQATPKYDGVLPSLDVEFPITVTIMPSGNSSVQATFVENENSVSVGANFTYRSVYQFGLNYTSFLGDSDDNHLTDRDFVAMHFKFTF
jgi:uncharacterized protein DUF1302